MNPFDFANSINDKSVNLMLGDTDAEKKYVPFIVNRAFSQFSDTALAANTMNGMHYLDKKMQYDFLFHTIKKRKRFSKWAKPDWDTDTETMISEFYSVSRSTAREYILLMTEDDLLEIKGRMNKGGSIIKK